MLSRKVVVWLSNILKLASRRIDYLDIACHIFVSPVFAEVRECLISNAGEIQFMITYIRISSWGTTE